MGKQPGFMLYTDCMALLDKLNDEQAGRVIKAACLFFRDGELVDLDLAEEMVLTLIVQYIQRSTERYDEICRKRSEAGKKGGAPAGNTNASKNNQNNQMLEKQAKQANITEHNITEHNITEHNITEHNNIICTKKQPKRFLAPSIEDVKAYCIERNNGINAEHFIDYYTSNGWMVGKNHMKDWKAAVRQWERNRYNSSASQSAMSEKNYSFDPENPF